MFTNNSTNLRNRVSKLYLPKTKGFLPLFEIISNSIHSIIEKKEANISQEGKIEIKIIRNGDEKTLSSLKDIDIYPIHSFEVKDNGIGLNDENMLSFAECDSEKKANIGGKGVGRLFCLKAFNKLVYHSTYFDGTEFKERIFEYKRTKEGFDKYSDNPASKKETGTIALLSNYESIYQKNIPFEILEIARQIVTHFQLYYIQKIEPEIIIRNQNNIEVNLTNLFNREFKNEILIDSFDVTSHSFKIFISRAYKAKSHKIHYCGHERSVREEGLSKYLEDLKFKIKEDDSEESYYFQVFIVGDFLDKNVNESRTSFNFSIEDNDDCETDDISLSKIRKSAILCIEKLLSDFLEKARKEKLETYYPIIEREFPNYHSVINYNKEKVERLPIGLSNQELDIRLYEIENQWRLEVKKEGVEILEKKKDVTSLDEYQKLYDKFLAEFNDIGKSDLARYVVHRRSVIDLLDELIQANQDNKFTNEDIIHSLFFPIRETRNTVTTDKQNLWLLDERLTFNSLLASDKLFKQVDELGSDSIGRTDIVLKKQEVFENATLFSEEKYPFESFTIIEFKKPYRNDYQHGNVKKDPIKQVRTYIREIIDGNIKKNGRKIEASDKTPFYCYIVADITDTLTYIIEEEGFTPMPDGIGYFRFYDSDKYKYKAYIEVLPFEKVIKNAKERNKILFDKLKLS